MSKRLQVLFSEEEYKNLKQHAKQGRATLGEWVRSALRRITDGESSRSPDEKLKILRRAMTYSAPTSDVEKMKEEIEKGYLS